MEMTACGIYTLSEIFYKLNRITFKNNGHYSNMENARFLTDYFYQKISLYR